MIGIYKITNSTSGKVYIGKSNNIDRRISEHFHKKVQRDCTIDQAIDKYSKDSFTWRVVEQCTIEALNAREIFWIDYARTQGPTYNIDGGGERSHGEYNGNAKLNEEDVKNIRKIYSAKTQSRKDVYSAYEHKISFGGFARVWDGSSWPHIMSEVYTKENQHYYSSQTTNGEKSPIAKFTNDEVLLIRKRYVLESARQIWADYKDRCSYGTLQVILCGKTYKEVPIYHKSTKTWSENL